MKRMFLWLMLLASLVTAAAIMATRQPASGIVRLDESASGPEMPLPFEVLNSKARAAKTADTASIRALADEVFSPVQLALPDIPAASVEAMKERLIEAETEYRSGNGSQKAIQERDVAHMVNHLADTLKLPDYARTSSLQVRHLRLGVWPYLPDFIAQKDPTERTKPSLFIAELKISSKMSPLEATYLSLLMLQQKANNVAFQVRPADWPRAVHKIKIERWEAHRSGSSEIEKPSRLKVQADDNPKVMEIRQVASENLSSLGSDRLKSLPDELLDSLGIQPRKEEQ